MIFLVHNLKHTFKKICFFNVRCINIKWISTKTYNVLFFGSDRMSIKSFMKVIEFRKQEKTIGRLDLVTANGQKSISGIESYAQDEGINILTWPLLNLKEGDYDLGLIVAFGHLIKDDVLNKFPLGMVNIHPSLLPRWRGAAPIIHTLLHGDEVTGVTLMKIKANLFDVGDIIDQREVPVSKDIKLPELIEQLSEIGSDMLLEFLKSLPNSLTRGRPQSSEGVTYAKKINKNISKVDWFSMSSIEIYNLYRAIYGLYPLTTTFQNKEIKLFNAFLLNTQELAEDHIPIGTFEYCDTTNALRVVCKDKKYIYFKSVRIVGKREISALDFYNGYKICKAYSNKKEITN